MKKIYLLSLSLLIAGASSWYFIGRSDSDAEKQRIALRKKIKEHPFSQRARFEPGQIPEGGKPAAPDRAWEQDYLRTMDPALGRPTPEVLVGIMQNANHSDLIDLAPGAAQAPWEERGPNNVGGRTRAL
ncbi:MAG: hypothetical protein LPK45_00335, partial [Bacteroidota bacterium]|nr:hypothetical protein [Bacteroidota bacterium]MDX5429467.1 hypothetical protein [Bacteroidota bacterium]MDX5468259.1 hypothetical protein [Bacteroidota bacterium]